MSGQQRGGVGVEQGKREVQGPLSDPLIQENPCKEKLEQSVFKNKLFQ